MLESIEAAAPDLVITRVFDAPRALVFKLWTEADRAARWWGPQGFTTVECRMDARVGGAWRVVMRSPEGTTHAKGGIYREVTPPARLVFTFAWEDEHGRPKHPMLVAVDFAAEGSRTRLTLRHSGFESDTARAAHRGGWDSTMDRLAAFLAGPEAPA